MRVLVDINVFLDVAFNRPGFAASAKVIDHCENSTHEGWVAWHTLATVFYLVEKSADSASALATVTRILDFFQVAETSTVDAKAAVGLGMADFEDALQAVAAIACGADAIITRNKADFTASGLVLFTPEEFVVRTAP
jgi:predicted nucleic acid-binding protein